jgi:hypothetical protein
MSYFQKNQAAIISKTYIQWSTPVVANPGPAGYFWSARTFRMALEEFMIDPNKKM